MKKNKVKTKTLMFLSAGFVCLMLTMTMVLFIGSSNEPIHVDAQNAQTGQTPYDLEEIDITDLEMPISKIGTDWNSDSDVPVELTLNDFADQIDPNAQVPEPATAALIIAGGIGMFARYRRKRG